MNRLLPIYGLAGICLIGAFVLTITEKGAGLAGGSAAAGFGVMTWAMQRESARRAESEQRAEKAETHAKKVEETLFSQTGLRVPRE